MAERKAKAGSRGGPKKSQKVEARRRRIDLASVPSKKKTLKDDLGRRTGVKQIPNLSGKKGGKTLGWLEDVPGRPDLVKVKNRWYSDHPQGRTEGEWKADALADGRPDAGSRIGNKKKYDENYDEVFGKRKRGVAAGHKTFKKKY